MKESISYSFLLNIILLFVFVAAAIVTGIFSYHRAFKANNVIISEIEKYEGYNCESKQSISSKLNSLSYYVPFNVKCKKSEASSCITDNPDDGNYAVVSYNIDYNDGNYAYDDKMNSSVFGDRYTKRYQYGVYTYMYINLPILSSILRIPVFSKTKELYEFRKLITFKSVSETDVIVDYNIFPDYVTTTSEKNSYISTFALQLQTNYTSDISKSKEGYKYGFNPSVFGYGVSTIDMLDYREAFKYYNKGIENVQTMLNTGHYSCGFKTDWSVF